MPQPGAPPRQNQSDQVEGVLVNSSETDSQENVDTIPNPPSPHTPSTMLSGTMSTKYNDFHAKVVFTDLTSKFILVKYTQPAQEALVYNFLDSNYFTISLVIHK